VLEGANGATLRATFLMPSPVRLRVDDAEGEGKTGGLGIRTIRAAHNAGGGTKNVCDFVVVMTVQRGAAPTVSLRGESKVIVGKQVLSIKAAE
jgi:hypothetical protein